MWPDSLIPAPKGQRGAFPWKYGREPRGWEGEHVCCLEVQRSSIERQEEIEENLREIAIEKNRQGPKVIVYQEISSKFLKKLK